MNLRRLKSYVTLVDNRTFTRAAEILCIAQPALSQHLATLEAEIGHQLLLRSKRGIQLTERGGILYRHAQLILRQCDRAFADVQSISTELSGTVTIGMAPGTLSAGLVLLLMRMVKARYPAVFLFFGETSDATLAKLARIGQVDLAFRYGDSALRDDLVAITLLREPLYLVGSTSLPAPPRTVSVQTASTYRLNLPPASEHVRKLVDEAFAKAGANPKIVSEGDSVASYVAAVSEGAVATIAPRPLARELLGECSAWKSRLIEPSIAAPLTLCQSAHLPLCGPAQAVKQLLLDTVVARPGTFQKGKIL